MLNAQSCSDSCSIGRAAIRKALAQARSFWCALGRSCERLCNLRFRSRQARAGVRGYRRARAAAGRRWLRRAEQQARKGGARGGCLAAWILPYLQAQSALVRKGETTPAVVAFCGRAPCRLQSGALSAMLACCMHTVQRHAAVTEGTMAL